MCAWPYRSVCGRASTEGRPLALQVALEAVLEKCPGQSVRARVSGPECPGQSVRARVPGPECPGQSVRARVSGPALKPPPLFAAGQPRGGAGDAGRGKARSPGIQRSSKQCPVSATAGEGLGGGGGQARALGGGGTGRDAGVEAGTRQKCKCSAGHADFPAAPPQLPPLHARPAAPAPAAPAPAAPAQPARQWTS
eukprot:262621-Chlamydomonas_euryale.AAC.1